MPRTGLERSSGRGWRRALAGALVMGGAVCTGSPAAADEWTLRSGVHVDAWSGAGQDGHQILVPLSMFFDTPV